MAINHTNVEKKSCYRNSSIQSWQSERASERLRSFGSLCARCDSSGRTMLSLCLLVLSVSLFFILVGERCVTRFLRFFLCTMNATRIMIMIMMAVVVVGGGGCDDDYTDECTMLESLLTSPRDTILSSFLNKKDQFLLFSSWLTCKMYIHFVPNYVEFH